MLFYHIIPAVHGTMCAQSNHAKHAVVIYGLPHEVYPAANVQRARGKAALCSCHSNAFIHSVSHVHSVLGSPVSGSGICCVAFRQAAVHQHPQALKLQII